MQLALSFSVLLGSLLIALTQVSALPVDGNAGIVTLPLKRVHGPRSDVHPLVLLQQHINRSNKRLARLSGRDAPSDEELSHALRKRVLSVEASGGLEPRYNRQGAKVTPASAKAAVNKVVSAAANGKGAGGKGKGAAAAAAGAAAGGGAAAAAAGATAAANSTSSAGFSPVAEQAAQDNTLTPASNAIADNSLGLDIEANDVGYIATVQMGTPPRDFKLLMDSGSADLWVGAEGCQSEAGGGCGNHVFLGPQSSSSFVASKTPFQVSYGTGDVSGAIIKDNINVAGLALDAHTYGVATTESVDFSSNTVPFDGLMGLAQSTLSQQKVATPVEAMASAGLIKEAITSFKLARVADQNNNGEVTFGGLDTTKFDQASLVTLQNVNQQGFWEADLDAASVNGKDLGFQGRTAILDTGTTLMLVPQQDAATIHAAITGAKSDGQGGFTVPCTTTDQVALTFGGKAFNIDPRDIAFSPVDPNNLQGDCASGISAGNVGGANEWLVGDTFLKNAYFSTNVNQNQIQLATLV